jgi:hypothetical protein
MKEERSEEVQRNSYKDKAPLCIAIYDGQYGPFLSGHKPQNEIYYCSQVNHATNKSPDRNIKINDKEERKVAERERENAKSVPVCY